MIHNTKLNGIYLIITIRMLGISGTWWNIAEHGGVCQNDGGA